MQGVGLDVCTMMDSPVDLGATIVVFGILGVLIAFASRFSRSNVAVVREVSWLGLFGLPLLLIQLNLSVRFWGITTDDVACTPFSDGATLAVLLGLDSAILGLAVLAGRRRTASASTAND